VSDPWCGVFSSLHASLLVRDRRAAGAARWSTSQRIEHDDSIISYNEWFEYLFLLVKHQEFLVTNDDSQVSYSYQHFAPSICDRASNVDWQPGVRSDHPPRKVTEQTNRSSFVSVLATPAVQKYELRNSEHQKLCSAGDADFT
jgi:hypothetical protein